MGPSASVTPIARSHCRIKKNDREITISPNNCVIVVVVIVLVVVAYYVVIFFIVASHCLRHRRRWSERPTDRMANHGSVGVVELAGRTVLGWPEIHPAY